MSCWVVPTIAAEFWGMPLEQVMQCINRGELTTKIEQGFMFVDVAPDSPIYAPNGLAPEDRPQTFTAVTSVTDDELAALADEVREVDEDQLPEEPDSPEPESAKAHGDWRSARRGVCQSAAAQPGKLGGQSCATPRSLSPR